LNFGFGFLFFFIYVFFFFFGASWAATAIKFLTVAVALRSQVSGYGFPGLLVFFYSLR